MISWEWMSRVTHRSKIILRMARFESRASDVLKLSLNILLDNLINFINTPDGILKFGALGQIGFTAPEIYLLSLQ